ncbi:hypothetical protein GQ472_01085 [archaeon]|nr:hypothetical protein [archaeon]
MSEEYIILAGNVGGLPDFYKAYGYLTHIQDQETISKLSSTEICNDNDLDMHFKEFPVIMDALQNMDNLPERYTVFTAEVLDRKTLEKDIPKFLDRYQEIQYRFCQNDERYLDMVQKIRPKIEEILSR